MADFEMRGVDAAGTETVLGSHASSGEGREALLRYTSREDAGGWDEIVVYDCRGESDEPLYRWERPEREEPADEWSVSPAPESPDEWWIDDSTGEYVRASNGERMSAEAGRATIQRESRA